MNAIFTWTGVPNIQVGLATWYIQHYFLRDELENEDDEDDEEIIFEIDQNTDKAGFIRLKIGSRFGNAA